MLRMLLTGCIILIVVESQAQQTASTIMFSGQVLDSDSIPVEQAYLVNYRTLRAYSTNSKGRFRISVQTGDSLKVIHVAYESQIVKPTENEAIIRLKFEENMIGAVDVKYLDLELQYFNKNMKIINLQLDQMRHTNYRNTKVQNPYNTNQFTGSTGIAISDIIQLFKKRK